jgi:hypothetical protein
MQIHISLASATESALLWHTMLEQGYKHLGRGSDATTWHRPGETTCVKLIDDWDAGPMLDWIKWSTAHKSKHYAKFYGHEMFESDDRKYWQIRMDLCKPLPKSLVKTVRTWYESVGPEAFKNIPTQDTFENAVLRAVFAGENKGHREDIVGMNGQVDNVMLLNNALVLVDPWSEY